MKRKLWIGGVVLLAASGMAAYFLYYRAGAEPQVTDESAWFADATEASGVAFVHDAGDLSDYWMPRINGSGVALFDFDGDGKLDLYFLNFGGPNSRSVNRLYKNLGGGKFQDATAGSGLGIPGHNLGVIVGDVNNDGWPDVVVTQYNGVKLFRNNGNGTFTDVTLASGLKNPKWAASANLFDYDRDGWLDLVIANYVEYDESEICRDSSHRRDYCGPHLFKHTVSKLFHNGGRKKDELPGQPRFEDVTVPSGLAAVPGPGLGVYCADFTGDGWPDIFIANDLKANHLWVNQQNGTFLEQAIARGIGLDNMGAALSGMGVGTGDVDNDGMIDVYVTHLTSESNTLWLQGPRRGYFRDRTANRGLNASNWRATGWGTLIADFDQDGWPDIAVANGRANRDGGSTPYPPLGEHFQQYGERNQIFRNVGGGTFQDASTENAAFCGKPNMARGLAAGDLDGDGALDLVVTTIAGPARIYRNTARNRGHWLIVRAVDPRLNRDAYGAEVQVRAGAQKRLRIVNPGDSFQSSSDPRVHFGLGDSATFESIRVLWPDGLRESFPGGAADRAIVLKRGEGREEKNPEGEAPR